MGDVDSGVKQVRDFLEQTRTLPLKTSDSSRPLTYSLALDAVLRIMYQPESWSSLTQGLDRAMNQDDGSTLLSISDLFSSRNSDGTYKSNGDEAIGAINCLDYPVAGDTAASPQVDESAPRASQTVDELDGGVLSLRELDALSHQVRTALSIEAALQVGNHRIPVHRPTSPQYARRGKHSEAAQAVRLQHHSRPVTTNQRTACHIVTIDIITP